MKIKSFNTETIPNGTRKFHPLVSFSRINGIISLNKEAVQMLKLKEGDKIEFHQILDNCENEWYLQTKNSKSGWALRKYHNHSLYFHCKALCIAILDNLNYNDHSGSMLVSKEDISLNGMDLNQLLTSSLKRWIKR